MKKNNSGFIGVLRLGVALCCAIPLAALAASFGYDANGRLANVTYDGTHTVNYQYDGFGNITNAAFTGTVAETDSDGDGMPDAWEWVWLNGLSNAAAGDYNQDTISNLRHYQDGTDPTNPDSDGDGMINTDELRAGTQPTNAASVFRASSVRRQGSNTLVRWQSVTGKSYRIARVSQLVTNSWPQIVGSITGIPPQNTYTDTTVSGDGPYHYRIGLE
jgi:YD repeat-containing protein